VADPRRARLLAACKRAVAAWGLTSQLRQAQEECGELVAAVNQADRGREGAVDKLAEEIADVTIMMAQARIIVGGALVDRWIDRKLERLEGRLAAAEAARG
jgi:NTP pyrophosphatase (non-canonical NTP hydrolase)